MINNIVGIVEYFFFVSVAIKFTNLVYTTKVDSAVLVCSIVPGNVMPHAYPAACVSDILENRLVNI